MGYKSYGPKQIDLDVIQGIWKDGQMQRCFSDLVQIKQMDKPALIMSPKYPPKWATVHILVLYSLSTLFLCSYQNLINSATEIKTRNLETKSQEERGRGCSLCCQQTRVKQ